MDSAEIIERYKSLALPARLLMIALISLAPGAWQVYSTSGELEAQLADVTGRLEVANTAFERAKKKKRDLPSEEQQLVQYEQALVQARKMLPDTFLMDDILHSTASEAINANLELKLFDPQDMSRVRKEPTQKWQALPVSLRTAGTYNQLAKFFDRILHFDKLIHFEKINLKSISNSPLSSASNLTKGSIRPTVEASAEMIIYASL